VAAITADHSLCAAKDRQKMKRIHFDQISGICYHQDIIIRWLDNRASRIFSDWLSLFPLIDSIQKSSLELL